MNKRERKTLITQLFIIALFAVLPVLMIYINGDALIKSIIWQPDETLKAENLEQQVPVSEFSKGFKFGIYNDENTSSVIQGIDYEVLYFAWNEFESETLTTRIKGIIERDRIPFIICEPWALDYTNKDYLEDIPAGSYDSILSKIVNVLQQIDHKIFLVWGHEMDQELAERYTWSGKNPRAYIMAYRYVVDFINNALVSEIEWIWAPVGRSDCLKYWPGEKYADAIGFPIYSFPEWDVSYYGYVRDFKKVMDEKYDLMIGMNKPIYITEYGVTGNADHVKNWISQTTEAIPDYPLVNGLAFFMANDTSGAWGDNISTPNWQLSSSLLNQFISEVKANSE